MKVILVNNLYGRHARGGAERVVESEARGLAARDHEPVVVSAIPESDMLSGGVCGVEGCSGPDIIIRGAEGPVRMAEYYPPNIFFYKDLHRHSVPVRLLWHLFDIWNPKSVRMLMKFVRREKPDVVHTHNLMGLGFSIPRALKREGVRHVHTIHDVQLLHPSGLLPADWKGPRLPHGRLYISIMKRRMGSPDVVLFPSEFMKELHERLGFFPESERVVLRNPVGRAGRAGKSGESGARRFLFVGQLEAHKGVLDLLDAWMLWDKHGDATLSVVGSGTLEDVVKRRAEYAPGVNFRGRLEGDEFVRELGRSSWLVVPSEVIENAPTVIVEVLARGIPVIASRTGGIPELVQDGRNGILFEPGDREGLLAALKRAADMKIGGFSLQETQDHTEALEEIYREQ
ncbi:MAG: glycosyltransferase family 4 protein [Patescibacteria group bacterium]|nr:glycosyltransferase family 4 protein [Patescibacteria group bacterium]